MSGLENGKYLELHDGLMQSLITDIVNSTITIQVEYYKDKNSSSRNCVEISFLNVVYVSGILDYQELVNNATSGNINYWAPAEVFGKSYIYLTNGCICIISDPPEIHYQ